MRVSQALDLRGQRSPGILAAKLLNRTIPNTSSWRTRMNIRMARETDFAQWLPLWKGYQRFYKTDIADQTPDNATSKADTRALACAARLSTARFKDFAGSGAMLPKPPRKRQAGTKHFVDARLPTVARGSQRGKDVGVQAQLHRRLADCSHAAGWASAPARHDLLGCVHTPAPSRLRLRKSLAQARQRLSCVSLDGRSHLLHVQLLQGFHVLSSV
jgi:hypothetical protein